MPISPAAERTTHDEIWSRHIHYLACPYGTALFACGDCADQVVAALRTENLARAKPGFLDRVIHETYVAGGDSVMLTCEKGSRKLANVEVIKDVPKGGLH